MTDRGRTVRFLYRLRKRKGGLGADRQIMDTGQSDIQVKKKERRIGR